MGKDILLMKTVKITELKPYPKNARTHSPKQIHQIAKSIKTFGFTNPVLVDKDNCILAGHGRVEAAKLAGLTEVPVVCITHLTPAQKKAYILADNRLAELSGWDKDILKVELEEIQSIECDFDLTSTGFEAPEIDVLLAPEAPATEENTDFLGKTVPSRVKVGDLWQLGKHKLLCADCTKTSAFKRLLGVEKADLIVTDPPYNVKISGHVRSGDNYREFAMASGEMSQNEFSQFLKGVFGLLTEYSIPGSLHYAFMDWRHIGEILTAGMSVYTALKNVCIWNKLSGGMGSLYRSQHELVFVFKNGDAPHTNNIKLGVHGRYRTNVWDYPGIFIKNKVNKANIRLHPTVKPVGLLADILLDASPRKGLVLDPFGGSGSTLLAAERTGRQARIIEIDPHYCDVIIYRWEQQTGKKAVHLEKENYEN